MRILFLNKYLFPKGGCETHLLELAARLARLGHDAHYFGLAHPENVTPPDGTTTIPGVEYEKLSGWRSRAMAFGGVLFNRRARRSLDVLLREKRMDVAHAHNIYHQLGPSVLAALHEAGVPCVLTAHDYKLVCPSYLLHDGRSECFACRGHRFWNVLTHGCSRKGWAGDLAFAIEAYVHHFLRLFERYVDVIIAPSRFLAQRLVEGGFDPTRIFAVHNAVDPTAYEAAPEPGRYMLYLGRLHEEKGLRTLLDAAERVRDVPLWIVGDGPMRAELEARAAELPRVRVLGHQSCEITRRLLAGARAVIVPSLAPENCPVTIIEAFASAKPVIASRSGGIPELFDDGPHGATIPPGDVDELAATMQLFWQDEDLCEQCGLAARRRAERRHDLDEYVRGMDEIYAALADPHRRDLATITLPSVAREVREAPPVSHVAAHSAVEQWQAAAAELRRATTRETRR